MDEKPEEFDKDIIKLPSVITTEKVIRAFWRRIYPYRNDYERELPDKMPIEFLSHMSTALMWLEMNEGEPIYIGGTQIMNNEILLELCRKWEKLAEPEDVIDGLRGDPEDVALKNGESLGLRRCASDIKKLISVLG